MAKCSLQVFAFPMWCGSGGTMKCNEWWDLRKVYSGIVLSVLPAVMQHWTSICSITYGIPLSTYHSNSLVRIIAVIYSLAPTQLNYWRFHISCEMLVRSLVAKQRCGTGLCTSSIPSKALSTSSPVFVNLCMILHLFNIILIMWKHIFRDRPYILLKILSSC